MTAPARDLHQELAQEVEDCERRLEEATRLNDELPSDGAEALMHLAKKRYERAVTRQRISEGRG